MAAVSAPTVPTSDENKKQREKEHKHHKHKKEKKSKDKDKEKERKDKKDKHHDKEEKDKEGHSSKHKKKKKEKNKDREKERTHERSKDKAAEPSTDAPTDILTPKLKINLGKTTPAVSPRIEPAQATSSTPGQQGTIPKIKIKFGGTDIGQVVSGSDSRSDPRHHKSSSSSSKKRERSSSSAKLDGPAAKMSRVIGTKQELESQFLAEHYPGIGAEKKKPSKEKSKPKL